MNQKLKLKVFNWPENLMKMTATAAGCVKIYLFGTCITTSEQWIGPWYTLALQIHTSYHHRQHIKFNASIQNFPYMAVEEFETKFRIRAREGGGC